ncbi:hypothetical protein FRC11_010141, partial [Ceratobasidium sp. 423]
MPALVHSLWGRDIEDYSTSDDLDRFRTKSTLSVDAELAGLRAMQKISRLDAQTQPYADIKQVDISTLECALRLSVDSVTIRHLANPPVISGCVYLLKAMNSKLSKVGY